MPQDPGKNEHGQRCTQCLDGGNLNRIAQTQALAEVVVDPPGQGRQSDQGSSGGIDTAE
jgi:hypothetical protein